MPWKEKHHDKELKESLIQDGHDRRKFKKKDCSLGELEQHTKFLKSLTNDFPDHIVEVPQNIVPSNMIAKTPLQNKQNSNGQCKWSLPSAFKLDIDNNDDKHENAIFAYVTSYILLLICLLAILLVIIFIAFYSHVGYTVVVIKQNTSETVGNNGKKQLDSQIPVNENQPKYSEELNASSKKANESDNNSEVKAQMAVNGINVQINGSGLTDMSLYNANLEPMFNSIDRIFQNLYPTNFKICSPPNSQNCTVNASQATTAGGSNSATLISGSSKNSTDTVQDQSLSTSLVNIENSDNNTDNHSAKNITHSAGRNSSTYSTNNISSDTILSTKNFVNSVQNSLKKTSKNCKSSDKADSTLTLKNADFVRNDDSTTTPAKYKNTHNREKSIDGRESTPKSSLSLDRVRQTSNSPALLSISASENKEDLEITNISEKFSM